MGTSTAATESLFGFFGRGGRLAATLPVFEYRQGQLEMARAVAQALEERHHLLIEAGTGTGKTLAYLLPALSSGRRVIVSTGTKNLQEQLVFKDIPLLEQALGRKLNVVCMKGRGNYACRQKIAQLETQPTLLTLEELDIYRKLRDWEKETASGDRMELDFLAEHSPFWERFNARREACTGQKCAFFESCFVTQLHQEAMQAELVIVNHHLFFADLTLKQKDVPGVLPPYEAVIFDEAHELEGVASSYFGVSISSYQWEEIARDTEHVLRTSERWDAALAAQSAEVKERGLALFSLLTEREGRTTFHHRAGFLEKHFPAYDRAQRALLGLRANLEAISDKPEEIHNLVRRLGELKQKLAYLLEADDPGVVFWLERRGRGVYLQATPIDVAALLSEALFQTTDTVILTSATLAVRDSFDYLRQRLGVEHARVQVVASPFDYRGQALLYLPAHLPDPRSGEYGRRASEEITRLLECSQGRAFVLFTSYEQMRDQYARLDGRLPYPMLLQGSAPRHTLLERFRSTPNAVLFATSSFWQGVDVQGEQLSLVIIDRLPFASPGDPVVAARIQHLNRNGLNAFMDFQVPEAVLSLKQGFGRLIRSAQDRGVVALLDRRVVHQRYGRLFLESLPSLPHTNDIADVEAFFAAQRNPNPG